jgi:hypothetical protein
VNQHPAPAQAPALGSSTQHQYWHAATSFLPMHKCPAAGAPSPRD